MTYLHRHGRHDRPSYLKQCSVVVGVVFALGKVGFQAEVLVGEVGGDAAALGAEDEAFLDQEGFIDFLQRAGVLGNGSRQGAHTHRTALEGGDEGAEDLVVDGIEAALVDLELVQGEAGDFHVDAAVAEHLREVAHALEQRVGDARRAAAP